MKIVYLLTCFSLTSAALAVAASSQAIAQPRRQVLNETLTQPGYSEYIGIPFAPNSAALLPEARDELQKAAEALRGDCANVLVGATSQSETISSEKLAADRTTTIRNELARHGMDPSCIQLAMRKGGSSSANIAQIPTMNLNNDADHRTEQQIAAFEATKLSFLRRQQEEQDAKDAPLTEPFLGELGSALSQKSGCMSRPAQEKGHLILDCSGQGVSDHSQIRARVVHDGSNWTIQAELKWFIPKVLSGQQRSVIRSVLETMMVATGVDKSFNFKQYSCDIHEVALDIIPERGLLTNYAYSHCGIEADNSPSDHGNSLAFDTASW